MPQLFEYGVRMWNASTRRSNGYQFHSQKYRIITTNGLQTSAASQAVVSNISSSAQMATTFLASLVMNAVNDVLQEHGRSAFLSDAVITLILQQLTVTINYNPLECKTASTDAMNMKPSVDFVKEGGCFIIDSFVESVCKAMSCKHPMPDVDPVPSERTIFTGNIKTSNTNMANWSRQMWQSVLNRVSQKLTSGSFGKYFSTAFVEAN